MKKKLSPSVALNLAELYNGLNLTNKLANIIIKDEETPNSLKADCVRIAAQTKNEMQKITSKIDGERLGKFMVQIHSEEPEGFVNVRRDWFKLNDAQRQSIETAITYALGGSEIKIVDLEN